MIIIKAVEESAPTPRKSIYQMPDMPEDIHNMSDPSIPPAPVVAAATAAEPTRGSIFYSDELSTCIK